ncbi:MAG: LPS export ABC transporter periplasmic protein LptC [Steroidobacteraceae bacterium]
MTRLLLLAALVALIAVLVQWRLLDRDVTAPQADATRPGYYLIGVDLEDYGTDGRLRIGLQSVSATEDPDSGIVRLAEVELDYHAPTGQRWHLTADEARVPPAARVVEFAGDVRLVGAPGEQAETAELRTATMTLDTEAERAVTRSPVQLAFGRHLIRARGMRADLKAGSLQLESDVSGEFAP